MTRLRYGLGPAMAVLLVAASACGRQEPTDRAAMTDADITAAVQAKFFEESAVKGSDIDVAADNGVVTLSGSVPTDDVRSKAEQIARDVDGVDTVQNRIGVVAMAEGVAGRPDITADEPAGARTGQAAGDAGDRAADAMQASAKRVDAGWITMKVQSQFFADDTVKGMQIDVDTSRDGRVTLSGDVPSEEARQRAVEIARGTDGVTDVVDRLDVEGASSADADLDMDEVDTGFSDAWVRTKIEARFFLDPDIKGRDIEVTSSDGVVTLSGEVETPAERRQAVALARATDGVDDVRDQLRVAETTLASTDTPAAARPDDDWIEARIESRFFMDDLLKTADIDVSSDDGVVRLEGEAPTAAARETAADIARETEGVQQVTNEIEIEAAAAPEPMR